RVNALPVRHAADNDRIKLPPSTGRAGQRFFVSTQPIVPESTHLEVEAENSVGAEPTWKEKPNFDRSGPLARHYVIDGDRGEVVFGDGRNALVPETGASLTIFWKTGGGATGNLPANKLRVLPAIGVASGIANWGTKSAAICVQQPAPAFGGTDQETLAA